MPKIKLTDLSKAEHTAFAKEVLVTLNGESPYTDEHNQKAMEALEALLNTYTGRMWLLRYRVNALFKVLKGEVRKVVNRAIS